jgi:hypothetical protein
LDPLAKYAGSGSWIVRRKYGFFRRLPDIRFTYGQTFSIAFEFTHVPAPNHERAARDLGESSRFAERASSRTDSGAQENAGLMGQEAPLARLSVRARYQRDSLLPKRRWACRYCVAAGLAQNTPINISAITELELFAFANLSAREESLIENLLATVSIITVDSRIARLAALARKSYGLKVPTA